MLRSTEAALTALLTTDATITDTQAGAALELLRTGATINRSPQAPLVYRPREAARLLGVAPRTVRLYGQQGKLKPVKVGARRAVGYTASSVLALAGAAGA